MIANAFHIGFLWDPTSIKNETLYVQADEFKNFNNSYKAIVRKQY